MAVRARKKSGSRSRSSKTRKKPRSTARSVEKQRTRLPFVRTSLVILAALAIAVVYVWQQEQVKIKGYEIRRLSQKGNELVEDIKSLKNEVARLEAPGRIERMAVNQLHMSAPRRWQTVPVHMGTVPDRSLSRALPVR